MVIDGSHVEAALGKIPFRSEQGIPQSILLKNLAMFLTNEAPALLQPEQQRALIPIAAEVSLRATETAIAQQLGYSQNTADINYKKQLEEALVGDRDVIITEEHLSEAITRVQRLDPKRDKRELEKLGALTTRYVTRVRNKVRYAPFVPKQ